MKLTKKRPLVSRVRRERETRAVPARRPRRSPPTDRGSREPSTVVAAHDADVAVLLHDELHGAIGRILDERDRVDEPGRLRSQPQLCLQIGGRTARDERAATAITREAGASEYPNPCAASLDRRLLPRDDVVRQARRRRRRRRQPGAGARRSTAPNGSAGINRPPTPSSWPRSATSIYVDGARTALTDVTCASSACRCRISLHRATAGA